MILNIRLRLVFRDRLCLIVGLERGCEFGEVKSLSFKDAFSQEEQIFVLQGRLFAGRTTLAVVDPLKLVQST